MKRFSIIPKIIKNVCHVTKFNFPKLAQIRNFHTPNFNPYPLSSLPLLTHNIPNFNKIDGHKFLKMEFSGRDEGFLEMFINELKQTIQNDEELQENVEELEKSDAVKAIIETYETTGEFTREMYEKTSTVRAEIAKGMDFTGEITSEMLFGTVDMIGEGISKLSDQKVIKLFLDEYNLEYEDLLNLHFSFRSQYAREKDAEKGIYYNPITKQFELLDEDSIDSISTDVVITEDGKSKKKKGPKKSIFGKLSDSLFSNEQSEALSAIMERDDKFDQEVFLSDLKNIVIPAVYNAYFRDDAEECQRYMSSKCFKETLSPQITARENSGQRFNTRILSIDNCRILPMFEKGNKTKPIIRIDFDLQYIHCVEDENGNVIEGGENNIQKMSQFWVLKQDSSKLTNDWEIDKFILHQIEKLAA